MNSNAALHGQHQQLLLHHYIIVRDDLPRGIQAAQIIHAAGESACLGSPVSPGTNAVALSISDEDSLRQLVHALSEAGFLYAAITENDDPYSGQLMAIGLVPCVRNPQLKRLLGGLQLLK